MKSVGGSHRAGGVVAAWMAEERQRERLRFTREAVRDLSEQLSWQVALAAPLQLLVRLVDGAAVLGSGAPSTRCSASTVVGALRGRGGRRRLR